MVPTCSHTCSILRFGFIGVLINALCLSPQPLPQLSPSRPYSSVFNAPLIVSVVAQFAVHLYFLVQAVDLCIPYLPE